MRPSEPPRGTDPHRVGLRGRWWRTAVLAAVVRALLTPVILATSAFMAQPAWFYAAACLLFAALWRTRIRRATSSRR